MLSHFAFPLVCNCPVSECVDPPTRPKSVLFIKGADDPLVPYDGGSIGDSATDNRGTVLSADASVQYWVDHDLTSPTPTMVNYDNLDLLDLSTVTSLRYSGGTNQTEVILYRVEGGGHLEPRLLEQYPPAINLTIGPQNHDIEMAQVVWDFLKDKRL